MKTVALLRKRSHCFTKESNGQEHGLYNFENAHGAQSENPTYWGAGNRWARRVVSTGVSGDCFREGLNIS